MAIRGTDQSTHLVSQNKCIRLWYWRLVYVSNVQIVRAFKLMDGIDLDFTNNREYKPSKVLVYSNDSEISSDENKSPNKSTSPPTYPPTPILPVNVMTSTSNHVYQAKKCVDDNMIAKLCILYIGSKSTLFIKWNKSMTSTLNKLEGENADLWGPHNLSSQSKSVYAAMFICKTYL